ncbi:MAG TPA: glycosyltransferase, partial [Pedobacter sp.]|nr:glycosyltransferase [Pedobacter sp.]
MAIAFWISLFLVFYTFFGYGILLYLMVRIKRLFSPAKRIQLKYAAMPSCTLIVAAYNEKDLIVEKIKNTLALNYPQGRLEIIFVTDGSIDGTPELVAGYPEIKLLHSSERRGKISAVHRTIEQVTSEVIVFTDANTFLNADALLLICRHY